MTEKKKPTGHCQCPPDRECPTGGTPGDAGCNGWRSCVNRNNRTTHGASGEPEYRIVMGCLRRVDSPYYRVFGIGIEPEWRDNPPGMIAYLRAKLPPYRPGDTLERIDNDRGYVRGNLKWADRTEQNQNRGHEDGARENGWHKSAPCLCTWQERQVCPCEAAKHYRAGTVVDREDGDWQPPLSVAEPDPSVLVEPSADHPRVAFLGSLFGEVRRDQYGQAWVKRFTLEFRQGIGPDRFPHVDKSAEEPERDEFWYLLNGEDDPTDGLS